MSARPAPGKTATTGRRARRRRWLRVVAAAYAILVAASWLTRAQRPQSDDLAPDERVASLAVIGSPAATARVRLVYRDLGPHGAAALPVLLLHGSPGRMRDFRTIAPGLAGSRRVLVPDLPGFGKSSRDLPDYSILAHARYALALLDELGVARVHVVGYSMGGGVGLHLAGLAPGRVASMSLLASIGAQEFELTGRYALNHALHGAQLVALWTLHRLVPHFGWMDDAMLDVPYARNFFDSDQRPLAGILRGLEMPVLILHGTSDPLVPYEAAVEHHRLVPQSELRPIAHGHFAPFVDGERLGRTLSEFLERVERGAAPTRAQAHPARVVAARAPSNGPPRPRGFGLFVSVAAAAALALLALVAGFVIVRRVRRMRLEPERA